ncbi:cytochrome c oxidase subunit 4 [Brachybacterium sp. EF45031]|uniref:cytochrome c oxidase subunit 4 n=1 Tax=Brachybacterium sillae TaxID=2810536 RepID=UPI00217E9E28|nr:cytochrome c oxidase subunit 4 [Brachybacterium sillae]MCS6710478.1 cytochrome c oxidase subunit 4 [Brachybacterium sillae]
MKTFARIFLILSLFFLMLGTIYGVLSWAVAPHGIEPVGTPAILALGVMAAMIAAVAGLTAKRFGDRPEEDLEAEPSDEAGFQGVFSPYSWWPFWTAIGASLAFLGVAAGWWITVLGLVPALIGLIGWVSEYSRGYHEH